MKQIDKEQIEIDNVSSVNDIRSDKGLTLKLSASYFLRWKFDRYQFF